MKKILFLSLLWFFSCVAVAQSPSEDACSQWGRFLRHSCIRLHQIWWEGSSDLYWSGYAWHNRYTYTRKKINSFNEQAYGAGFGRSFLDEDRDLHALFAFAFLDSHKNVEPIAGYGYAKLLWWKQQANIGLGFTFFVTARPDIYKGRPFPGALPLLTAGVERFTVATIYIPGAQGAGNVLYIFGKWRLD